MRLINKSSLGSVEGVFRSKGRQLTIVFAGVMLLLLAALFIAVSRDKSENGIVEKSAYLILADYSQNKVIIKNSTAHEVAKTDFPYPSSYVTAHAVTPAGAVLMSVGAGSSSEAFFFANRSEKIEPSKELNQSLALATTLNGKRNIIFTSEDTAVFVICPDGQTCSLSRLNIKSGKNEVLADSGVVGSTFNPVYLLGASNDKKSVYLRVSGTNKFGGEASAVYKFDLATNKVSSTIKVPVDAGQNLSLSPDEKRLVYKTGGLGKEVEIKLIDVVTKKETKLTWNKAEIGNMPSAFVWSPDGQRILFMSSSSIARATSAADNPQKLAYLDTKDNKITELLSVTKTYLNSIFYYSWLDNDNIVYEQAVSSKENDFGNSKKEINKQDIKTKKTSKIDSPAQLEEVLFW